MSEFMVEEDPFPSFDVIGEFGGSFTQTRTRHKKHSKLPLCRNWRQTGACSEGDACKFRHATSDEGDVPPLPPCGHWKCSAGSKCLSKVRPAGELPPEPTLFKIDYDDTKVLSDETIEAPEEQNQDGFLGFVCRWPEVSCRACGKEVVIGSLILPAKLRGGSKPTAKDDFMWIHVECKDGNDEYEVIDKTSRNLCKHWNRTGKCAFGHKCYFRHYLLPGEVRPVVKEQRTWGQRRRKVRNNSRASVFRRFLLQEFGSDLLSSGCGVLDIAAGKGEIAFQLVNLSGIPCTVIEPRKLRLNQFTKRLQRGMYHRNRMFSGDSFVTRPMGSLLVVPRHLQICLDHDFVEKLAGRTLDAAELDRYTEYAKALGWNKQGLNCHESEEGVLLEDSDDEDREEGGEDAVELEVVQHAPVLRTKNRFSPGDEPPKRYITDLGEVVETLNSFSMCVGMHPDQATEIIVDLALSQGKPFAVVPCCVYSVCFPKRALKDGTRVTSYEQFIAYLIEKDPERIKTRRLAFEGKNIAVYAHGKQ